MNDRKWMAQLKTLNKSTIVKSPIARYVIKDIKHLSIVCENTLEYRAQWQTYEASHNKAWENTPEANGTHPEKDWVCRKQVSAHFASRDFLNRISVSVKDKDLLNPSHCNTVTPSFIPCTSTRHMTIGLTPTLCIKLSPSRTLAPPSIISSSSHMPSSSKH